MMWLPLWITLLCGSALLLPPSSAADAESQNLRKNIAFQVTSLKKLVIAEVSRDVVLSCCLSPRISAEDMKISWFRPDNENQKVHLYLNGMDDNRMQEQGYSGRTALFKAQIRLGCVELQIIHVRLSDEGTYTCYFEAESFFSKADIELRVVARGSDPLIHVEQNQDGGLNLVCITQGWYPEPEVWWEGNSKPNPTTSISRKSGQYNVTATVHTTDTYTCSVRSSLLNDTKMATVSATDWEPSCKKWILLTFLFTGTVGVIIIILFFWMLKKRHPRGGFSRFLPSWVLRDTEVLLNKADKLLPGQGQEQEDKLLPGQGQEQEECPRCLSGAVPYIEADVILDQTTCPRLDISKDRKQVKLGHIDGGLAFQPPCALGCQGFMRGKHFWVMEVGKAQPWALGVAVQSVSRLDSAILNPEEGIWAVGLSRGQYQAFTTPVTELSPHPRPEKLIVYLDLEAGQLSFYNAATRLPIYSFMCSFTEEVFPFVWTMDLKNCITLCPPSAAITSGQPQQ